jgi:long-chain fatty acid transport protein
MRSNLQTSVMYRAALAAALIAPIAPALATNGMLMEGYGPISTGMGGASQAINHGTAAMAQNPATLALMADGSHLDLALGVLGPKVTSSVPGMSAPSGGTSYVMPAVGYTTRAGSLTYGVGLFAQGGMGTEYDANTFLAAGSGSPVRSELGVGKLLVPLAYQVNANLAVGATLDFMWADLDLLMAAPGAQLGQLVTGASGNIAGALGPLSGAPWARINFSDGDKNTGAAKANGFNAKLGAVYKMDKEWTIGGSYQFKSNLSDMTTANGSASMTAIGGFSDVGKMTVIDFQWPAIMAVGASWQATPELLVAADIKSIGWSEVMKSFKMRYDSAGMGGSVSFALPQNWKDQTVLNLGMAWKASEVMTLRAGVNLSDNPVPDSTVNPLFPATVKNHYTLGLGYRFSNAGHLNASLTVAPVSNVTSGAGVSISHEQTNVQLMYSHRF